jgi:histone H3/H4
MQELDSKYRNTKSHKINSFPKFKVEKLIKEADSILFTEEAIILLNKLIIKKGMEIASIAASLAKKSSQKEVKESDIRLAELYC